ncbi:unnamed protein product [Blepharisma stoltei]|uniref:Uncharacterized protein n=1 Tax=Blepharisma stoltei TaxID=1481888 RepID=A0AAU9J849_9CILI|nr:unnamed protein product [Blepharisma stoltei]
MTLRLPYGLTVNFEEMWTTESQLKHLWHKAIRKNMGMRKCFVFRLNGKYAYANAKVKLTPDINTQCLSLCKKWENSSDRQTKWTNKAHSVANHFIKLRERTWNEQSIKSNEEKKRLRTYIPEIILDNPNTLGTLLKSTMCKPGENYSFFKPTPARAPLIYYIADKFGLCLYNTFFPYRDYYHNAKKEYETLPKEFKALYIKANELDALRHQAETMKCASASFLNFLNHSISWREIYRRPFSTIFGENLRSMSKINVFMPIRVENWISAIIKKIDNLCKDGAWRNKKNKVLKDVVNELVKKYPKDEDAPLTHYTLCGENLNNYTPTLFVIEQSIWHQESWLESSELVGDVVDMQDFPLTRPYSNVNLGYGIEAKLYKIEDVLFDSGYMKKIREVDD